MNLAASSHGIQQSEIRTKVVHDCVRCRADERGLVVEVDRPARRQPFFVQTCKIPDEAACESWRKRLF
jgi:hypothetical protein